MGTKRTYQFSIPHKEVEVVAKRHAPTPSSTILPVTQEELDYLAEGEQRILSAQKQYIWEPANSNSSKPMDNHVEFGKPVRTQSLKQHSPVVSPVSEEPAANNCFAATQLSLPFNNLSASIPTNSVIAAPLSIIEGDATPPEQDEDEDDEKDDELYFPDPDDDSNPQFLLDGKEIFEEELLPHHFEKEDDIDANDTLILEKDIQENNIADLVDILGEEKSISRETYDFHDYYEPDEYDDKAGILPCNEIQTSGKVSKSVRARQIAMETGQSFGLTNKEILLISEIFQENGWAATRVAIERELKRGATVDELHLAAEAKRIWQEHNEYGCGCRNYYTMLSWPMALRLVRSFFGYPDSEIIEDFFVRIFEHWRNSHNLMLIFWPFSCYLSYRLGVTNSSLDFMADWTFEPHPDVRCETILPPSSLDITRINESRFAKHLLRIRASYPEY